jgi:putative ABC transport system permease protein
MRPVEPLGLLQVLLILIPIAVVASLSLALRLGQVRRVSVATARAVVQLLAVGLVIGWVFDRNTWYWILGLLLVMTTIAGFTAAGRMGGGRPRLTWLMSLILGGVTAVALLYYTQVVIGLHAWDARYFIPLGGMLLGNAMTAATLAVERVGSDLARERNDVEVYLSLGASPWQASLPAVRRAIGAALTPTLNAMLVVGVVKLPGMMTGQMLGGSEPLQAALYQLLILGGILFCDSMAATLSAGMVYRRLFTPAWQLDGVELRKLFGGSG